MRRSLAMLALFVCAVAVRSQAPKAPAFLPPKTDSAVKQTSFNPPPKSIGESLRYTQVKVAASIGHDSVITDDEVWQSVRGRLREYGDLTGPAREAKEKQIYKEELRELIGRELIVLELFDRMKKNKAEAKIDDIKKFAGEQAEKDIAERRKRQGLGHLSEAEFIAMLQSQGLSYKTLKRQLEQETLSKIYLEQIVKDKVKYISINDLWDYYQSHPKDFAITDRVKWLDLFVSFRNYKTPDEAKAHATAAWKSAMAGADFVELVKKMGQGDSNLRAGEGIGQKRGEIQPTELEPVIFDMAANQVSPLLQTATGYHIVKVVEREKAGTLPFDEKVQALIRAKLSLTVQEKERQRIVEELWRRFRPKVVES
jgi:parvulin-like peptidyl-prolyl isomerase